MKISLLPETVPTFLDKSFVVVKGEIKLNQEITSTIKGTITLNSRSLFFLAANLFNPRQSFELILKRSELGSDFSQITLPPKIRPKPPTRENVWWPGCRGNGSDKEYVAHTFVAVFLRAFRRPSIEKPHDGIEVFCRSLDPISRLSVEVEVRIRKWALDKYPKLLP